MAPLLCCSLQQQEFAFCCRTKPGKTFQTNANNFNFRKFHFHLRISFSQLRFWLTIESQSNWIEKHAHTILTTGNNDYCRVYYCIQKGVNVTQTAANSAMSLYECVFVGKTVLLLSITAFLVHSFCMCAFVCAKQCCF